MPAGRNRAASEPSGRAAAGRIRAADRADRAAARTARGPAAGRCRPAECAAGPRAWGPRARGARAPERAARHRGRREALRGGRRSGRPRRAERGRGEGRCGAGLRLRGGRLLLGDLAAEILQQRVEAAVEALPHGGEPPDVLEVEVAQHHGTFGGEFGTAERVPGHFLTAGDDAEVSRSYLRHLSGAVDRRREGQLLDPRRDPVEGDPEGLRVTRLRAEQLDGLLGGLRLVEEDEVPVVRKPFVGVQAEAADVEGESGAGDLHTYVQIGARGEVTDLGLVAALEFPGHA